jgi:hypothetical protein
MGLADDRAWIESGVESFMGTSSPSGWPAHLQAAPRALLRRLRALHVQQRPNELDVGAAAAAAASATSAAAAALAAAPTAVIAAAACTAAAAAATASALATEQPPPRHRAETARPGAAHHVE